MNDGNCAPEDCDCDGNAYHMCCLAVHFPSVVDNAAEKLEIENKIVLGQSARRRLYEYGHEHVEAFQRELNSPGGHDKAVIALHRHLVAVGATHGDTDKPLNPPQVDLHRLNRHLADGKWLPGDH